MDEKAIQSLIVERLVVRHGCHTLILYGSRARGDADTSSDYDVAGICDCDGDVVRDTELWQGAYLDLFIYPSARIIPVTDELLKLRGGKVLCEKGSTGEDLLRALDQLYERGPTPLADDERNARSVWYVKMLNRIQRGDAEADYRRAWMLTALLEDYFVLRNQWYEGPKASFMWFNDNQPGIMTLFRRALAPNAGHEVLGKLVHAVIHPNT